MRRVALCSCSPSMCVSSFERWASPMGIGGKPNPGKHSFVNEIGWMDGEENQILPEEKQQLWSRDFFPSRGKNLSTLWSYEVWTHLVWWYDSFESNLEAAFWLGTLPVLSKPKIPSCSSFETIDVPYSFLTPRTHVLSSCASGLLGLSRGILRHNNTEFVHWHWTRHRSLLQKEFFVHLRPILFAAERTNLSHSWEWEREEFDRNTSLLPIAAKCDSFRNNL